MRIWRKLFFLFRRGKFNRDLKEEIRFHYGLIKTLNRLLKKLRRPPYEV